MIASANTPPRMRHTARKISGPRKEQSHPLEASFAFWMTCYLGAALNWISVSAAHQDLGLIPEMVASCAPRTRFSCPSPSRDAGGVSACPRIPSHGWANDAMFHSPRPRAESDSRVPGWTCVLLQSDHSCKPLRGTRSD